MRVDGSGRVELVRSTPVLRPDEQVLRMMLDGWRNQQLSRNLQFATIEQRLRHVQRFIDHVNVEPWNWTPAMVEEFSADLRAVKHVAHSTLRGYHSALRAFTSYISNPDYGWDRVCERYFGTHPAQVFFDWNTAPHVQAYDGRPTKRPYTREELDALFEHADDEVERISTSGRKGWQPAYRDAVMMKVAYGYGLRFNELRHLQTVDFARNPHAREFGGFGVCKVRYGKSTLELSVIDDQPDGMSILLGKRPTDVPEPFAQLLRHHIAQRPNLRTGAGADSPWLFPSSLAGRHLHPNTVMNRLRDLGVNLLGARNRAIGELVLEVPPSLVADALGYSPQIAFLHADKAAEPWSRYAGRRIAGQ